MIGKILELALAIAGAMASLVALVINIYVIALGVSVLLPKPTLFYRLVGVLYRIRNWIRQ